MEIANQQMESSPEPAEERHPLCPPLRSDDPRICPMVYGYCVSGQWLLQYERIIHRPEDTPGCGSTLSKFRHLLLKKCRDIGDYIWELDTVAKDSQGYMSLRKTESGEYISVLLDVNNHEPSGWKLLGACNNTDYDTAKDALCNPKHAKELKELFRMPEDPQWFWLYKGKVVAEYQPWTRHPSSKIVKRRPFEVVDDPRDVRKHVEEWRSQIEINDGHAEIPPSDTEPEEQ
ncbi:hypothetical protein QCA50_018540 [Cerrena zonata]|uniref:Uncharacterized protein n=1 Tax=Cerrena zonata TaxID=2478898 RepID=A0AAW0FAY2_9APHY